MLKRIFLGLAIAAGLLSPAYSAGTLPGFSVSQQMDKFGKPLAGCKLFIIQAGTVGTPQNAYFDSGLTLPTPNPLICDAAGRIGQFFLADGSIKVRLTDVNNLQILTADGLLVVGPSGGGGGGGGVDPTTILATGDLKVTYGVGTMSGFVRANGRTIGSATSGATERANADTSALFSFLWSADPNLIVSTGRGVSAAADFAANKTIALPDWRGRALAGLDDMGNTAAGRLTATYFGATSFFNGTTLGAAGGNEKMPGLATANMAPYTPSGSVATSIISNGQAVQNVGFGIVNLGGSGSGGTLVATTASSTFTGTAQGGTSTAFSITSPMMLATIYLKL